MKEIWESLVTWALVGLAFAWFLVSSVAFGVVVLSVVGLVFGAIGAVGYAAFLALGWLVAAVG